MLVGSGRRLWQRERGRERRGDGMVDVLINAIRNVETEVSEKITDLVNI